MTIDHHILDHLTFLYGADAGQAVWDRLRPRLEAFRRAHPELQDAPPPAARLTERDAIVITYGDQIREPGTRPLRTLGDVLPPLIADVVTGLHILPFFPYSSDDGFSVIDYRRVNPDWGDWDDIARLKQHFRLMFDAVINHISRQSAWFQGFLRGDPAYRDFFIVVDPSTDLSQVVRPRALPLLTPAETAEGVRHVWTTFSEDQIDLNFANPQVLLEIIDVLLFYVERGAEIIRLDAIAYLWKEIGTSCIHLPQTHRVVKLFRAILDLVAPGTLLITETNVPHDENVSYFGDGTDEAQLVYQFSLPPLTLDAIHRGDARHLQRWAATLTTPGDQTTFFNFLASHDGIGVRPAEGILSPEEIQALVDRALAHGGFVSYKANPDGSQSPYELNINYFDALNDPASDEPTARQVDRFMASQAILLAMAGVPGIYIHSLLGSRGWPEGVQQTGRYRTINRQKFDRATLEAELADPASIRHQVFTRYRALLQARASDPAFHPNGGQQVLSSPSELFCLMRTAPDRSSRVLCIHNVSDRALQTTFRVADVGGARSWRDLISGLRATPAQDGSLTVNVPPYGVIWLRAEH